MSQRKLLKIKRELDFLSIKIHLSGFDIYDLNLQLQQLRKDLLASKVDMKREAEQPFDSEVDQHQRDNEVNFDLPPKFDEYEDKQEEIKEEEKEEEDQEEGLEEVVIEADVGEMLLLEKVSQNSIKIEEEEHEEQANIHVCLLLIQPEQVHPPSYPHKLIPFTPIQDLSCSGPKLAHFAPSKKNPNPPHVHFFPTPLHPIPTQFPRDNKRETIFKTKPGLFDWLILFQPSSIPLILGQ